MLIMKFARVNHSIEHGGGHEAVVLITRNRFSDLITALCVVDGYKLWLLSRADVRDSEWALLHFVANAW